MQRQLTSPREFPSIINQIHGWINGSGDWSEVFTECHTGDQTCVADKNSKCSERIAKICENVAEGNLLLIGKTYIEQEPVTCICDDPATKAFSPLTSYVILDYEFEVNYLLRFGQVSSHWSVDFYASRAPERMVRRLRERLEDQCSLSDVISKV
ncbi:hypothetical protein F4809DRAFT_658885 [Biscogniauxia mediterranea]|nr:hypothetical protein F4809DRAFT_658885 [Biscogniauxia mediterranea]